MLPCMHGWRYVALHHWSRCTIWGRRKWQVKEIEISTWIIPLPVKLSPISRLSFSLAIIWPYHALRPFKRVTYVSASKGPASFSGSFVNKWVINIISDVQCAKYTDLLVALSLVKAATIPEQIKRSLWAFKIAKEKTLYVIIWRLHFRNKYTKACNFYSFCLFCPLIELKSSFIEKSLPSNSNFWYTKSVHFSQVSYTKSTKMKTSTKPF